MSDHRPTVRARGALAVPITAISGLGLLALFAAVFATPAQANPALLLKSLTPEDNTSFHQMSSGTLDYQARFDPQPSWSLSRCCARVEVATQNIPGQDGTLADDYQVDYVPMTQSDAYPDTWNGSSTAYSFNWLNQPGTYYWQFSYFVCVEGSGCDDHLGPVRSITIATATGGSVNPPSTGGDDPPSTPKSNKTRAKPVLRMTTGQAKHYTLAAIRKRAGRPVGFVRRRCRRLSKVAFRCRARWNNHRSAFVGQFRLRHFLNDGHLFWTYRFSGRKAMRQCLRAHRAQCWHRMR